MNKWPEAFLARLYAVEAKRPKTVILHILKHGFITSQELKDMYGYNHPPRAIRDVREQGIPIETYRVEGNDGRRIAAYKFGDPSELGDHLAKAGGRTALSKTLKDALITKYGSKCFIYLETISESILQIDHRVPFEIGGNKTEENIDTYMLISPSANRAKSWACEHCINWQNKEYTFCLQCFWAYPESYEHVAGNFEKVISIVFTGNEIEDYYRLMEAVGADTAQKAIKKLIHDFVK